MPPFTISANKTSIHADPAQYRARFEKQSSLLFDGVFEPELLAKLVARASAAPYVEDFIERVGTREIEAPQRVGATVSLLLGRIDLLDWLETATGLTPLRATVGRLAQTRANRRDALDWHDDMVGDHRKLGLVVNMSDQGFTGGAFEMRRKGEALPFHCFKHEQPGSIMVFAVNPEIEHRVTLVTTGGPRRVYAGWVLTQPEYSGDPLARPL